MTFKKSMDRVYGALLGLLLAVSVDAEADSEGWPVNAAIKDGDCFDYVIIGSGIGSVVANRLTENPDVSVLILEAGTVPSNDSRYAGNFPTLPNSYMDWQYKSEPELATQSQSGNVFKLASGLTLGGSSQINHMIWLRGAKHDFDRWSEITNDPSWSYESVLPYFLKSEAMKDIEILMSTDAEHNTEGPIDITRELSEKNDKYLEAFEEIGEQVRLELNGLNTTGYTQPTVNHAVLRQSTSEKYLKPIVNRTNFYVSYKSVVTKINFVNKVAVSVNVDIEGKNITIRAKNEIILSAGVFGSPKLLMLSGIGPKEHLESFQIPVIQDLPVGQNLQDHAAVMIFTKMNESSEVPETPSISSLGFPAYIGAVKLNESLDYPQGQTTTLQFPHDSPNPATVCEVVFGYDKSICDRLISSSVGRDIIIILAAVVEPKSSGRVLLNSNDPFALPNITLGFYSDPSDLDKVVSVIQNYLKVLDSQLFKDAKAEPVNLDFENCAGVFSDCDYLRCYSLRMTTSLFHQTSSCSMGSVVDSSLNVIGVEGLRLADASVMPYIPTANPMAAAVMIGEKASDMIKSSLVRPCLI